MALTASSRRVHRGALLALGAVLLSATACGTRVPDAEFAQFGARAPVTGATATGATATGATATGVTGSAPDGGGGQAVDTAGTPTSALPGAQHSGMAVGAATGRPASAGAAAAAACSSQGSPIRIGQVGTYSGFVAPVVAGSRAGLAAWAKSVNVNGGVACHPVEVYAMDDGADASRAAADVHELVDNKHVVAIVGSFVPLSINGFKSAVEAAQVPAVGGDVLGNQWNKSAYMFPEGAGIDQVLYGSQKQLAQKGLTKQAIIYCVETDICANAYAGSTGGGFAARAGTQIVYSAQVSLTQPDYTAQCQNAKNAGAQFLSLYVDGSSMTRIARSCASIGYVVPIATSAIAIGAAQSQDPNVVKATVSLAPGVFPWTQSDNPAEVAYQDAMKRYAPQTPSDGSTAGAWASGELFAAAIHHLGEGGKGDITKDLVMKGLGMINNETLGGLVPPITFSAGQPSAPFGQCYYDMILVGGTWTSPNGSKYQCVQ
jgi:branched-chain amino acid transport system substrate-binding protein